MNANEETTNIKRIETIDSSELSSNISDEQLDLSLDKIKFFSPTDPNEEALTGKCKSSKKLKEKRTRFYSENVENYFDNRNAKQKIKIKKINNYLKNVAIDELINSNPRKFTFS